jgi:hypothetical protein
MILGDGPLSSELGSRSLSPEENSGSVSTESPAGPRREELYETGGVQCSCWQLLSMCAIFDDLKAKIRGQITM